VNTHANTVVFSFTASKPNSQVIPRSGSRMTVLLTTVLEEKKELLSYTTLLINTKYFSLDKSML